MAIAFTLNGKPATVEAPPEMPLLWVLRDELDLKGTKFGCGRSFCWACTVHVDGTAERSCRMPVSRAEGKEITTIEGLVSRTAAIPCSSPGRRSMCRSAATARPARSCRPRPLLASTPAPTDGDIDEAMSGNLCRCATYTRIRAAIHRAAEIAQAPSSVSETTGGSEA